MANITIIAQGTMGSGVGRRLSDLGHHVGTVLAGRSEASVERARAAGMKDVAPAQAVDCDLFLSILPPSEAEALARQIALLLQTAPRKPTYVDCNAISPDTMRSVAAIISAAGGEVVDVGIIGGPPKGDASPAIYASGLAAAKVRDMIGPGLDIRVLEGPVGAASALKMCYAGLTKGFQALGISMLDAAVKAGAGDALIEQLAESQPDFLAYFDRQVPAAFSKAYRFVGEMEEISAFLAAGGNSGASAIYAGMAELYASTTADVAGPRELVGRLNRLLKKD